MDQTLRWSRRAAELVAAAIGGGVVVLGGAAALGKLDSTTTVVHESGATLTPESAAFVRGKHMSVNQIYEDAAPGVVHITATTKADVPADPFFGLPGGTTQQSEIGSGFVIDKNGDIITNDHVVAGASSVRVSFSDNESMDAKLVGEDPSTDVAVLRVSAPSRALRPLVLGNSDGVRVGDQVLAIGNPFGLDRSASEGIVSAVGRSIQAPNQVSEIDGAIQTDAAINHGNSGGPLLNADGEVIGVTAQIDTGGTSDGNVGIGFAIPINTVRQVAGELIEDGKVEHPFLGITVQSIDPQVAQIFHLPVDHGLMVARVVKGSGASKAGLKGGTTNVTVAGETWRAGGDIVVAADGHPVTTVEQLRELLGTKKPGDTMKLEIYHDTSKEEVGVKLGRLPATSSP
ncbi:MAG TPA: trypsin-like peptidase domain-containing protein [Gaiellaceae bacterium]|nr:trypsin-like peptidase domain-containing protein [Gaiellaceae bacterium]